MKRTFKRPDGSEETLEGTPEELAEHERKLREEGIGPKTGGDKPGVLHGATVDGVPLSDDEERWVRMLRGMPKFDFPIVPTVPNVPSLPWDGRPLWPEGPIWVISCSICQRIGCDGNHAGARIFFKSSDRTS